MTLTTRSKIALRYTTAPAAWGYGDSDEEAAAVAAFMNSAPDFVGTPRQVLKELAMLGGALHDYIMHAASGEEVTRQELLDAVLESAYARRA